MGGKLCVCVLHNTCAHVSLFLLFPGELKGVMRVGSYARGVMLKGECSVQLVLMCADKPTTSFFNTVASQFQEKLEVFLNCQLIDPLSVSFSYRSSRLLVIQTTFTM